MSVIALGLNYASAPIDVRARFAFTPDRLGAALREFRGRFSEGSEVAIVSTCNRTELYLGTEDQAIEPAFEWLAGIGGMSGQAVRDHTYLHQGGAAARHAFRVASGLDSMVLGEPQILGQLKQAVREAESAGTLGRTLHQMFQRSFAVAKEVRTSTEIGAHSISMAAAAVRLAERLFEDLRRTRVLFVGAGEMIELVATHFAARTPRSMAVANRTLERGERPGGPFRRRGIATGRSSAPTGRVRYRDLVHRKLSAFDRAGRRRARAQGTAAPPHVHGRPGRTA